MKKFDFIIIGAGSAGCVLANKLSKSGKHKVLLLEAGQSDNRFWIKVPIGYGKVFYDQGSIGNTQPRPNPISITAASIGQGAKCWADPVR